MIKEFKVIWNRDRSTKKDKALSELAYVYHSCDYQSIYRNYHIDTRESKVRLDIFGEREWKPDSKIMEAITTYQQLQTTLSMQLLNDVEIGLTKLRDYFREPNFDEDENGVAAKNFIANIKSMGDMVKSLKILRDEVEKELTDTMQLRGRTEIGQRELPPERRG
jgi:hypothetical protein